MPETPCDTPLSTRRCIVTGETTARSELIRFVVGPENRVVPDLAARLPGRGLWVRGDRTSIAKAVKQNAFSRAARRKAIADDTLPDVVEKQLRRKCLDRVSLARRAGQAVSGFEKVLALVTSRRARVVLCAGDAGRHGRQKLVQKAGNLPVIDLFDGNELSLAFGRENVVHAALTLGGFADHLLEEAERLGRFCMDDAPSGAPLS